MSYVDLRKKSSGVWREEEGGMLQEHNVVLLNVKGWTISPAEELSALGI